MELLKEASGKVIDTDAINKGAVIWAKHSCWSTAKTGIVSAVTSEQIRVLYHPDIANVTMFFTIHAADIISGNWEMRWSDDLETIYGLDLDEETEEEPEEEPEEDTGGSNEGDVEDVTMEGEL